MSTTAAPISWSRDVIIENYDCGNGCIAGLAIAAIVCIILVICAFGWLCFFLNPEEEADPTILAVGAKDEKKKEPEAPTEPITAPKEAEGEATKEETATNGTTSNEPTA